MTQLIPKPQKDTELSEVSEVPHPPKPNPRRFILIGFAIAGIAAATWYFSVSQNKIEPLQLSGRIEGYETDIGAKTPGRIDFVAVREGDRVQKGQVIVRLDDGEIKAQLQGAKARLDVAKQQVEQARGQISMIESQIEEAQLNWQQAQGDAKGRIFQAESNVAAAQAQQSQAQAQQGQAVSELKLAKVNRDRFAQLVKNGAVPQQQFDQAQTAFETAQAILLARQAAVDAARKQVSAAQGALEQAQTTGLNAGIRQTRIDGLRKQLIVTRSQLVAAQAEVANAQAAQQQIIAQMVYLNIVSPIDGVVMARSVEPGAVVTTGKTLLTLIDPNTVYLRGYIPEGEIGKVKIGQAAKVFLDSAPEQPLSGRVSAIDPQASFTPENIYFKSDRVKQVFGVKISIDQPGGLAKPGMPADAELVTEVGQKEPGKGNGKQSNQFPFLSFPFFDRR